MSRKHGTKGDQSQYGPAESGGAGRHRLPVRGRLARVGRGARDAGAAAPAVQSLRLRGGRRAGRALSELTEPGRGRAASTAGCRRTQPQPHTGQHTAHGTQARSAHGAHQQTAHRTGQDRDTGHRSAHGTDQGTGAIALVR